MRNDYLNEPVEDFVQGLAEPYAALARQAGHQLKDGGREDCALEAFNLVLAITDADGRHTDDELWATLATFGPRFPTQLGFATPNEVRAAGFVVGKRAWLDQPSSLFDLLVKADVRNGTSHAWTYYREAMAIAQVVVALDAKPTETELRALDGFRSLLVSQIESAGIPRPGSPRQPIPPGRTPNGNSGTPGGSGAPGTGTPQAPGAGPTASATGGGPTAPNPAEDELPPAEPLDDLLDQLEKLVGLHEVKAEVRLVTNLLQIQQLRKERGLPVVDASRHLVFTGNPGTGKTTVARLLAKIYRTLGVVEKGHLVETDRAGMVAGFVGQTALKVTEVFDRANQGVLLIDEAYALARGGERDFGQEAIDTLVKLIEDRRETTVVIAAGYPDEMADFIDSNPGLRSRFPKTIRFADYSTDELVAIFSGICKKNSYEPTPDAVLKIRAYFDGQDRGKGFGNGRVARNLFEQVVGNQATRLVGNRPRPSKADAEPGSNEPLPNAPLPNADHERAVGASSSGATGHVAPEPSEEKPSPGPGSGRGSSGAKKSKARASGEPGNPGKPDTNESATANQVDPTTAATGSDKATDTTVDKTAAPAPTGAAEPPTNAQLLTIEASDIPSPNGETTVVTTTVGTTVTPAPAAEQQAPPQS